jgi:putative alpha-1,2-mannosidase
VIKASQDARPITGYVSFDDGQPPSVTRTLDVSREAHAVAVIAAAAGDRQMAGDYAARAVFYRLLYDPESGVFRGRDRAGRWRSPFPPSPDWPAGFEDFADGRWEEALWTASLFDIEGLLELLGGQRVLRERLDAAFGAVPEQARLDVTRPTLQHTPWLYGFTNRPERIRQRLDQSGVARGGIEAHAAAWRLFRILGFYPVLPASGDYMLAPPAVREARLDVGDRSLVLVFPGGRAESWRGEVKVDGQLLPGRLVSHQRLGRGGTLTFVAAPDAGAGRQSGKGQPSEE